MMGDYKREDDHKLKSNYVNNPFVKIGKLLSKNIDKTNKMAICLINFSNLSYYNYIFGYDYGCKISKTIYEYINRHLNKDGSIYWVKDSELLIILHNVQSKKDIEEFIKGILMTFNKPINVEGKLLRVIVNLGISRVPQDSKEINTALMYSEIALKFSENNYKNNYEYYNAGMYEKIVSKGKFEVDIYNALHNKEFIVHYQPQVNVSENKMCGMEALLRWNHPKHGIVYPNHFIDIVEQNGMINDIGEFVFLEACNEIIKWNNLGYNDLTMSINLSERQLASDNLISLIDKTLQSTKVNPQNINIEITEHLLIKANQNIFNKIKSIRDRGIKVFIDDFGTKHSCLNYLYNLPVDEIKLDKSFVDMMSNSEKGLIITRNIVQLANDLKLEIIAEGIEDYSQLRLLTEMHCNKMQGFYFGKPKRSDYIRSYIEKFKKPYVI